MRTNCGAPSRKPGPVESVPVPLRISGSGVRKQTQPAPVRSRMSGGSHASGAVSGGRQEPSGNPETPEGRKHREESWRGALFTRNGSFHAAEDAPRLPGLRPHGGRRPCRHLRSTAVIGAGLPAPANRALPKTIASADPFAGFRDGRLAGSALKSAIRHPAAGTRGRSLPCDRWRGAGVRVPTTEHRNRPRAVVIGLLRRGSAVGSAKLDETAGGKHAAEFALRTGAAARTCRVTKAAG